jgi:hypothetical protein
MRFIFFTFLFFFFELTLFGNQAVFRLPENMYHFRIDFKKHELWKETNKGTWDIVGKLNFNQVKEADLPSDISLRSFKTKFNYLLTIEGTGQVYRLDIDKLTLDRLDNTYYRGYNFNSIQFFKNDTLFSVGGIGFWHANNVLTYFKENSKEWELVESYDENGPRWMKSDFGGYDKTRRILSVIEFPYLYDSKSLSKSYLYFEKAIDGKKWNNLGMLNVELLNQLGISQIESVFLNGKYFFLNGPKLVWAEPSLNEIYEANVIIPMFNRYFEHDFYLGHFYSYNLIDSKSTVGDPILIDSISINRLKSISTYKGPFYIQPYEFIWKWFAGIFLVLTSSVTYYLIRKRKVNNNITSQSFLFMPDGTKNFMKECLTYPCGHLFSSQSFTELMGYGSYSYETQRQFRSKLIKDINKYFLAYHSLDGVIVRQTAKDDKRFSTYHISDKHYDALKALLTV